VPRARILLLLACTLALGLGSRALKTGWFVWDKSLGDVLYAVAVYLVLALAAPRARPQGRAIVTFGLCLAIELFQLTGIPAALGARRWWVRLVLGTSFAWHDVACYAVGVAVAALLWSRLTKIESVNIEN
jgi:hypothetical protein